MSRTIRCIYASRATPGFRETELPRILETSRANNAAVGVTGMLLYVDGNFFQVLEGDEAAVTAIFERICRDTRHGRVTQIIREPVFERDFPEWTMGYARVGIEEVQLHVGENDFFTAATCIEQLNPGRARKLLAAFRQGRWRSDSTGMRRTQTRMAG
jgi:hypothetical protein